MTPPFLCNKLFVHKFPYGMIYTTYISLFDYYSLLSFFEYVTFVSVEILRICFQVRRYGTLYIFSLMTYSAV